MATVPHMTAAQDQTQTQGERVGPGGRGWRAIGRGGRMGGPMGGGLGEVMRDLTDAQREQVKAIREKSCRTAQTAGGARTCRSRRRWTPLRSPGNTGNLQALSIEVGNAETELAFAQAQVQSEIYAVLTAEQKQKIAERRKAMEQRRAEMVKRRQNRTQ